MASFYAASRPLVTVQNPGGANGTTALPSVFLAPIRSDVVRFVTTQMAKNRRQAYAVSKDAGHQTAAQSWGTGRAVSRIPRVPGSGTSRAGQGAFGNMCRGGRMFAPTRTWRRWHRKINRSQRRYAVTSALAATALPALVLARGHRVEGIPEVPLVVADSAIAVSKTKDAVKLLKSLNAYADVEKVVSSKKVRRGKGKMRNRRYTQRRGPLVIHDGKAEIAQAFRNLPGVELADVSRLNLLTLAPGGHLGRFCIWTESAFKALEKIYGNGRSATQKNGFQLPRPIISNADIGRVINSDEVQSQLNAPKRGSHRLPRKKNPLNNLGVMQKLNPYARTQKRKRLVAELEANKLKADRAAGKTKKPEKAKKAKSRSQNPYYKSVRGADL